MLPENIKRNLMVAAQRRGGFSSLMDAVQSRPQFQPRGVDIEPVQTQMPQQAAPPLDWSQQQGGGMGDAIVKGISGVASALMTKQQAGKQAKPVSPPPPTNQFAAPNVRKLTQGMNPSHTLPWLGGARNKFAPPPGFARGGIMPARREALVGEKGSELSVDQKGRFSMLGSDGAEVVTPNEPMMVIPADLTRHLLNQVQQDGQQEPSPASAPIAQPPIDFRAPAMRRTSTGAPEQQPEQQSGMPARRSTLVDASLVSPPNSADASSAPPSERFDSVMNGSAQGGQVPANQVTYEGRAQMPRFEDLAKSSPEASAAPTADARRSQLESELVKLYGLENSKAVDKNGRLKSGLLGALRGALSEIARTGDWKKGIGGALGGFGVGALHPSYDEEIKLVEATHQQRDKVDRALAIERELAALDRSGAQADAARAKNMPGAQAEKSRAQKMREATQRLRLMGNYAPGRDETLDALVTDLGLSPKQGGGGFNPQKLKTVGQDLVYVDFVKGEKVAIKIYSASGMTEAEKRRQSIDIARLNEQRARDGLGPLAFPDDLQDAPDAPAAAAPASAAPSSGGAPASNSRTRLVDPDTLTPTGAKPEPVTRRGARGSYRRRSSGRASSGGNTRDLGFAESGAADARAKAAEARARGNDDAAVAWEEKARVEDERVRRAGGKPRSAAPAKRPSFPWASDPLGILN